MKWYFVPVIVAGLAVGWIVFWKKPVSKPISYKVADSIEGIKAQNLPTIIIDNNLGKRSETVEVIGIVEKWMPDNGEVEFMSEGKLLTLKIDPKDAIIFTPSRKTPGRELLISDTQTFHWQSVFCKGDSAVFRLDSDKVVFVSNTGFRSCGFKQD